MKRYLTCSFAVLFGLCLFPVQGAAHPPGSQSKGEMALAARQLAAIRKATAKYLDVNQARADGYKMVSAMVPNMGYHFRNPTIRGFAIDKPNLLLYVKNDEGRFELVAVEWAFPVGKRPKRVPFQNPQWAVHGAACHFRDGSEIQMNSPKGCPKRNPKTGAPFAFWHPPLDTLHVWAWYPNPEGLFRARNPMLAPFNDN